MSANRATRASVLRSPPPPRRTGIFLTVCCGLIWTPMRTGCAKSVAIVLRPPRTRPVRRPGVWVPFGGCPGEDPRGRQAGQQVRGPQERPALGGRQLGEQAFLVVLYLALHRLPVTRSEERRV